MASSISINSKNCIDKINNNTFVYNLDRSVDLTGKEIALNSASIYYSWRNINTKNNKLSYFWNGTQYNVVFPIGFYEITDLNNYLQLFMKNNGHVIEDIVNESYLYFIEIKENNTQYKVDINTYQIPTNKAEVESLYGVFSVNVNDYVAGNQFKYLTGNAKHPTVQFTSELNEILGFIPDFITGPSDQLVLTSSSSTAPNVNPNSAVDVICDQAHNEFSDLGLLHTIIPQVRIGSLISDKPPQLNYLPLKEGRFTQLVFRFNSSITGNPMEISDPSISLNFSVRNIAKWDWKRPFTYHKFFH